MLDAKDLLRKAKALKEEEEGKQPVTFEITIGGKPFGVEFLDEVDAQEIELPQEVPEIAPTLPQEKTSESEPGSKTEETRLVIGGQEYINDGEHVYPKPPEGSKIPPPSDLENVLRGF